MPTAAPQAMLAAHSKARSMSVLLINNYLREIDRLRQFSGASTEKVISEAFKDLLKAWARSAALHSASRLSMRGRST